MKISTSPMPSLRDIECMSYNDIVQHIGGRLEPPGGLKVLAQLLALVPLRRERRSLVIGPGAAYTALEIAGRTGTEVDAVEPDPAALSAATYFAKMNGLSKVSFHFKSPGQLPFDDNSFDLVFCPDLREIAVDSGSVLEECIRVLGCFGTLALVPVYYTEVPDHAFVNVMREAIGQDFPVLFRREALELWNHPKLERLAEFDWVFSPVTTERVSAHCDATMARTELATLPTELRTAISARYRTLLGLHQTHQAMMGFTLVLSARADPENRLGLFAGAPIAG